MEFAYCERRRCVIESIADDAVNEPEEMFSISLNKVSSFVTLSATTGNVVIVDDDGKMLKKTVLVNKNFRSSKFIQKVPPLKPKPLALLLNRCKISRNVHLIVCAYVVI